LIFKRRSDFLSIKISNLGKCYGDFKALDNVSLEVHKNSINSIVGHNGSGKTTLVKCLSTLLLFDSGSIEFFGEKFDYRHYNKFRKRISLLLDASRNLYLNLTLLQNVKYFLQIKGTNFNEKKQLVDYYLEQFSLTEHKNKLVSSLSKGMQQKTALIIALSQNSDLIILDEPNLGLDLDSISVLKVILRQECKNRTVILTTQDVKLIEDVSKYLAVLDKGVLKYHGTIEQFNTLSQNIICSIYLNKEPTQKVKGEFNKIGQSMEYKGNIVYGSFSKDSLDSILKLLQRENYVVLDIKTHEGFENNLKSIESVYFLNPFP